MTVLKLLHLMFIYTSSLIIKEKKIGSIFQNYFELLSMQNKNKLNNKKGIHLSGNDSYVKGDFDGHIYGEKKKSIENRERRKHKKKKNSQIILMAPTCIFMNTSSSTTPTMHLPLRNPQKTT